MLPRYLLFINKKNSVSDPDPDPVGSGYFDKLGSGSGLNTRIPDPGSGSRIRIPTKILSKINLKFSYFLLKLIIGCVLNQPQVLKIFFTE